MDPILARKSPSGRGSTTSTHRLSRAGSTNLATLHVLLTVLFLPMCATRAMAADCLGCHAEAGLQTSGGRSVVVSARTLRGSAHTSVACTGCHDQPGRYEDTPHFVAYRKVRCTRCHEEATASFVESFHGKAAETGVARTPTCLSCHRSGKDDHAIVRLDAGTIEAACRQCHPQETRKYDTSVHAKAAASGKHSPGCTGCHPTHSKAYPPSVGAIEAVCVKCHGDAMKGLLASAHGKQGATRVSCAACHDVHAMQKPAGDVAALQACAKCHPRVPGQFAGSVHAAVFADGPIDCLVCHQTHSLRDRARPESFGCGTCHDQAEQAYRKSAHRLARLHGNRVAALCGDCHGGHQVRPVKHPDSPVQHRRIPDTCGRCHTGKSVTTANFVRLPISLPRYYDSVHGKGWRQGKHTAVCTDCHGSHDMEVVSSPSSAISKQNLARTCGQCHKREAAQYVDSIHGRAVAHGIHDSPTCTDCHEEHHILRPADPLSPVHPANLSSRVCAQCHQDPEMAARYGLPPEVIGSYDDSYHGRAVQRGGRAVAVCIDCHGVHDIGSALDPKSAVHKSNVVKTCGKCHPKANTTFAASYTHVLARGKRMPHDIARIIYLWLLLVVLGGMVVHNLILYASDLRGHYREQRAAAAVRRMNAVDLALHGVLIVSFFLLALSGFALRFPGTWWARVLTDMGFSEEARRLVHRIMAGLLVVGSVGHLLQVALSRRGRMFVRAMLPALLDFRELGANILHHLGQRRESPRFHLFDYTQKVEYWALVWGTMVMGLTGFVLWFPTTATRLLPAWAVRVCEVVHYYEAILAVSAIIIWHLFFVVFRRGVYPMSWTWVTGRMPLAEWQHHHGRAATDPRAAELVPRIDEPPVPPAGEGVQPAH